MSVERARELRKAMTPQERSLWQRLKALRSQGHHFRRQSPEGPFTLDFVCRAAKLVVEVDGVQHAQERHSEEDRKRDKYLRQRGFLVLRFWAADVEREPDGVIETILNALSQRPTRRAARDTLPGTGREGARYRRLVRLGLGKR